MANASQLFERGYHAQLAGDASSAAALYQKALIKDPKHGDAAYMLGTMLAFGGKLDESIPLLERADRILKRSPMVKCNLGLALKMLGRLEAAETYFRQALAIDPNLMQALNNLSALLVEGGCPCEAEEFARRCIAVDPGAAGYAYVQLGNALADQGRINEAIAAMETAVQGAASSTAWDNLLSFCHYSLQLGTQDILSRHQIWGGYFKKVEPWHCLETTGRIRVGYLSPDFGMHPVGILIEPLLVRHDRQRFEIFMYHDRYDCDEKSEALRACVEHWLPVAGMNDIDLMQRIKSDRIDILVDLCGHLAGNRMSIFAMRASPAQVTYLGYPGSTGLPSMDFAISDTRLDPSMADDGDYTESLIRLTGPSFAFQIPAGAPEIADVPSYPIIFGSFNNTRKISIRVLEIWAEILRHIPESRLVFQAQGLAEPARRMQMQEIFARAGIAPERLEFHGFSNFSEHLKQISRTHICLDTWPWNGHMTTLNCLWMGVPVVTLVGDRRSARMGASIMAEIGMEELVADSVVDYVDKALALAADPNRLAELRRSMRLRMQASRVMDAEQLTRNLEAALSRIAAMRGKEVEA